MVSGKSGFNSPSGGVVKESRAFSSDGFSEQIQLFSSLDGALSLSPLVVIRNTLRPVGKSTNKLKNDKTYLGSDNTTGSSLEFKLKCFIGL